MRVTISAFVVVLLATVAQCKKFENGCCSFPCHFRGHCMKMPTAPFYECDCEGTGHYGVNCTEPTWSTWFKKLFKPSPELQNELLVSIPWVWSIINNVDFLRETVMTAILKMQTSLVDVPPRYLLLGAYPKIENAYNRSMYARILPPVPKDCPKPMGIYGKNELPDMKTLRERIFARKRFIPSSVGTNLFFGCFAQHFTHSFFKSDLKKGPGVYWGDHHILMSNVYGPNMEIENHLRSFSDGKLRSQMIGEEEYPLFLSQVDVPTTNPLKISPEKIFATGHYINQLLPNMMYFHTIFLREHNKIADMLAIEHPDWDEEQIFQTAKLVSLGQMLKIVVEEYFTHLTQFHFKSIYKPQLTEDQNFQYQNRASFEFNILYHWHQLMPSSFKVSGKENSFAEWGFNGTQPLIEYGTTAFTEAFTKTWAGQIGPHNHGPSTVHVATTVLQQSRDLGIMPLNFYRRRFGLKPYKSFMELTQDRELANTLEELYGDVNAVEMYVGMVCEHTDIRHMVGITTKMMGSAFAFQGVFGNMFSTPKLHRASTFGGDKAFRYVHTSTLRRLICGNLPGGRTKSMQEIGDEDPSEHVISCPVDHIGFKVPDDMPPPNDIKDEL